MSVHNPVTQAVRDFIDAYEDNRSYKNHVSTARQLDKWWSERRESDITEASTDDLIAFLQQKDRDGASPGTLTTMKSHLGIIYNHFDRHGDNPARPRYKKKFSNEIPGYSVETMKERYADNDEGIIHIEPWEVRALRENVPSPKIRNELLIKMMVQTGARRNEIVDIQIDRDLYPNEQRVTLRDDKTNTQRTVPYVDLSPELGAWINKSRNGYSTASDSDYLFLTNRSEKLSCRRVTEIVRLAADNADIQDTIHTDINGDARYRVTPHTLRHTYGMQLVDQGVSVRDLQQLMGHNNISQTETYLNASDDKAAEAYRKVGPSFEGEKPESKPTF